MNEKNHLPTPAFDLINPASCVNGKLRKLHRMINALYMQRFKPYDLRGSMVSILFIIGKMPGIHQKKLSEMLVLDQSTMSRDLKKLLNRNLIQFLETPDARMKALQLSPEGCELIEEISPVWNEIHTKVHSLLGDFNIQQIDQITKAIRSNFNELEL